MDNLNNTDKNLLVFIAGKVFYENKEIGNLIYKIKEDKSIYITWIENQSMCTGFGRLIITKLFEETDMIKGDSTAEALGFWKKVGSKFLDQKRIEGGIGSRFILLKKDFLNSNLLLTSC